jgi:hypothetical protein
MVQLALLGIATWFVAPFFYLIVKEVIQDINGSDQGWWCDLSNY